MSWKGVSEQLISGGARLAGGAIGSVLLGPGMGSAAGAKVGGLIAGWLGVDATPDAVAEKIQDPQAMARVVEQEKAHAHELAALVLEAQSVESTQTGQTYRAELASSDEYVRRARPTFIYRMSSVWSFQVVATFSTGFGALLARMFVDGFSTADFNATLEGLVHVTEATVLIWGAALSVVGIYQWRRSTDKQTEAGQAPPPGIGGVLGRMMGKQER